MLSTAEFSRVHLANELSLGRHRLKSVLQAIEDAGGAHAAADAHGDHAVASVAALQFADNRGCEFCAGAAKGVAEGDGSAVGIDASAVEAGLLDDGERLRGEGFVEFDD